MGTGNFCKLRGVWQQTWPAEFMDFCGGISNPSERGFKPRIRMEPFSFKTRKKNLLEKSEMSEVTLFSLRRCGTRKCCLRARWNKVCAGEPFLLSACFAIEEARFSRGERPKVQTRRKEVPSRSHPTGAAREKSPARLAAGRKFIADWNTMPLTTSAGSYRPISRKLPDAVADRDHMLNKNTGEAVINKSAAGKPYTRAVTLLLQTNC
jgi:hypothetical protein